MFEVNWYMLPYLLTAFGVWAIISGIGRWLIMETTVESKESYRHEALKAAKDLCYDKDVIEDLKKAKTIGEMERIMATARKRK